MYIVTDTHPWVWFLTASPRLSQKAKSILSDPSDLIILPSIVMREIKYLYQHKCIILSFENEATDTDLKIIEQLQQLCWKRGDALLYPV
ncbi:MAG: hypothetical protein Q7J76_04310 [Candidatus Brocadiaceae bacterium]|nr:hypothetical protein [Candidatus Brocadiaceae bacterium]